LKIIQNATRAKRQFFVHPLAIVESNKIGPRTRVWPFTHVMKEVRVGADCNIGEHVFLENGADLGNNVTVKNGVSIWAGITIEDNVFVGPNCVFTNDRNPRAYVKKSSKQLTPTRIRANATVGANATLLCGITIGRYAFVGAGSVVIHSVPDFSLVVGNPSRQIGWMCVCANRLPLLQGTGSESTCTCAHCNRRYSLTPDGLVTADIRRSENED